jgi:hypothetical protein
MIKQELVKCANYDCTNNLTEFELNKIKKGGRRSERCKFCIKCRLYKMRIHNFRVNCSLCGEIIYYNDNTKYCKNCKIDKNRKRVRAYYKKTHPTYTPKRSRVIEAMRKGGITNNHYKQFGIKSENSFFNMIKTLRKLGYNIKKTKIAYTRYYIEE